MEEIKELIRLKERFDLYGIAIALIANREINEKLIAVLRVLSFEEGLEHWQGITLEKFLSRKEAYYDQADQELTDLVNDFIHLTAGLDACNMSNEIASAAVETLAEGGKLLPYIQDERLSDEFLQAVIRWINMCSVPVADIHPTVLVRLLGAVQVHSLYPFEIKPAFLEPNDPKMFWGGNSDSSMLN